VPIADIIKAAANIKEPITLAALAIIVTFLFFKQLVGKYGKDGRFKNLPGYLFVLALVAITGAILSYLLPLLLRPALPPTLFGTVVDAASTATGVPSNVSVRLRQTQKIPTTSDGDFSLPLADAELNLVATIWAEPTNAGKDAAGAYGPSVPIALKLRDYDPDHPLILQVQRLGGGASVPPPKLQAAAENPAKSILQSNPPFGDTKSPSHFYFLYGFQPSPGRRDWTRVSTTEWVETYPDGQFTQFTIASSANVEGCDGTVATSDAESTFEVFIPNKDCELLWARFRHSSGQWLYLGQMQDIQ
jgi:hypothetical protein